METIALSKDVRVTSWDVGGRCNLRALWRHYFKAMDAIVFVLDSTDRERMEEARSELDRLLANDELLVDLWCWHINHARSVPLLSPRPNLCATCESRIALCWCWRTSRINPTPCKSVPLSYCAHACLH